MRFHNRFLSLVVCGALALASSAHALEQFAEVDKGKVYRGGHPISPEDFAFLKNDIGIKTLLNLEYMPSNIHGVREGAANWRMRFINIPINPIDLELMMNQTDEGKEKLIQAITVMSTPSLQPVYVHCMKGADRTSLAVAAYKLHVMKPPHTQAEVKAEMHHFHFKEHFLFGLEDLFQAIKEPGSLAVNPATLTELGLEDF